MAEILGGPSGRKASGSGLYKLTHTIKDAWGLSRSEFQFLWTLDTKNPVIQVQIRKKLNDQNELVDHDVYHGDHTIKVNGDTVWGEEDGYQQGIGDNHHAYMDYDTAKGFIHQNGERIAAGMVIGAAAALIAVKAIFKGSRRSRQSYTQL